MKKTISFRFVSELHSLEGTVSTGKKEGSGRRTGSETDVQTRRSVSCILPCRSPLNYTDEAFYWRLKRELIKLATIFCRIEKKERNRRELPVFFDERLVKIAAHSSEIMLVFSRRRGKFFLEKEGRRFVEFLWQRNRWKISTRVLIACMQTETKLLRSSVFVPFEILIELNYASHVVKW